jgi:hypothetical protein
MGAFSALIVKELYTNTKAQDKDSRRCVKGLDRSGGFIV